MARQPRPKSTANGDCNRWWRGETTDQNETPAATSSRSCGPCPKLREVVSAYARDRGSEGLGSGKGIQKPLHLLSILPSAPHLPTFSPASHRDKPSVQSPHGTASTHRSTASFLHISRTDPTRALHEWVIWVLSAHASPCLSQAGTPIFLQGHSPQALHPCPPSITPFHPFLRALPHTLKCSTWNIRHPPSNASLYIIGGACYL